MARKAPPGLTNVTNPDAAPLASAINRGGDLEALLREALVDAALHHDWARVVALENSLMRVDQRTRARELQALFGRGCFFSRSDNHPWAKHIPDGFDHGIAWLVCCVILRPDQNFSSAILVADKTARKLRGVTLPDGVLWPDRHALVITPSGFGPPSRVQMTEEVFAGYSERLVAAQNRAAESERAMDEYADHRRREPIPILTWGCVITGAHDPSPLFEAHCPVDDLDLSAAAKVITGALADAAEEVGGDCHIHPTLMSALAANAFALWSEREQCIESTLGMVYHNGAPAHVVVSPLVAPNTPYMDMIMVSYWSGYGGSRFAYHFPRSTRPLAEDVERTVGILRSKGVTGLTVVPPRQPRPVNTISGVILDCEGNWRDLEGEERGRAKIIFRDRHWPEFPTQHPADGHLLCSLPTPHLLNRLGVVTIISEHFQKEVAHAVKEELSHPGEPYAAITRAVREQFPNEAALIDEIERFDRGMLHPARALALAIQFKLAGGACAVVSPALQVILDQTDLGDDVPVEMLRPAFDVIYLRFDRPFEPLNEEEAEYSEDPDTFGLDGVMVQRFDDESGTKLLLDGIVVSGGDEEDGDFYIHMPLDTITATLKVSEEATLGDLRRQVEASDDPVCCGWILDIVAGVLLYMNSKNARTVDRTAVPPAPAGGGNPGKREGRPATFGHILVGPDAMPDGTVPVVGAKRTVKIHYRRGYVRVHQRVGKGRSETRPVFIHPVLVNAKLLKSGDSVPEKKDYWVGPDKPKSEDR